MYFMQRLDYQLMIKSIFMRLRNQTRELERLILCTVRRIGIFTGAWVGPGCTGGVVVARATPPCKLSTIGSSPDRAARSAPAELCVLRRPCRRT
jgi:hypothetical protein